MVGERGTKEERGMQGKDTTPKKKLEKEILLGGEG